MVSIEHADFDGIERLAAVTGMYVCAGSEVLLTMQPCYIYVMYIHTSLVDSNNVYS